MSFGIGAVAVEPRYNVVDCPSCGEGVMVSNSYTVYDHTEDVPCSHGKQGNDSYVVYKVVEESVCNYCGYTETDKVSYTNGSTVCHGY